MNSNNEPLDNQEDKSEMGHARIPTIEELRAADPETRLKLISTIEQKTQVELLRQLTMHEKGEMIAVEMVRNLNANTKRESNS